VSDHPICPTCGQPATVALAGPEHGWECGNEACSEFGQSLPGSGPEQGEEQGRPRPAG